MPRGLRLGFGLGLSNHAGAGGGSSPTVPAAFIDANWSVATGAGANQITVTIASLPNNGGATITDVEYDIDASGSWASLPTYSGTGDYILTMAAPGVSYAIRLRAVNSVGNATAGNSESATSKATVPGVPQSLSLTPGDGQVALTWSAPASNGGSAITDYVVQRSTDDATWSTLSDGVSATTGHTDTTVSNGTLYYYRVAAVNAQGTGSYTASSSATPAAAPSGPEYLELDATEADVTGWTISNRDKVGIDLTGTAGRNSIGWDLTETSTFAEGSTFVFDIPQGGPTGTQWVRVGTDNTLSTGTRDIWSGSVPGGSTSTTVSGTITSGDISAGRIYFGVVNVTASGTLKIQNFTMGGNATTALDMTEAPTDALDMTTSGASATGVTLTGASTRNHASWALPHYTGFADTETIDFDIASSGRVIIRVGFTAALDTAGSKTYVTVYDDTPGLTPVPVTVTITSAMVAAHQRFFGFVTLAAGTVEITNFTTSTSPAPASDYTFDVASDTSTVGVTLNGVSGADTIFDVTDSNTGATGWNGEQITVATADIETGVPFGIPPEFIDESPARTFNTRAGLWLASDGTETAPEIESDIYWTLDGSLIAGEDGNSYVSASNEDGLEIKRYEAVAAGGIPAVGSPFVVTCRAAYPEVGLQFTGSNQWFSNWLSWGATQNVLWFMSFRSIIGANHRVLGRDASNSLFVGGTTAINLGGASETYTGTTTRRHLLVSLSGVSDGACTVKTATWTSAIAAGDPPVEATISTTANRAFSGSNNYFGIHGHPTLTPSSGSSMVLYRNAIWNMGATTVPDIFDTTVQQKFFAGSKIVDPEVSQDSGTGYGLAWIDIYGAASFINNSGGTAQHYGTSGTTPGTFNNRGSENITEVA